MISDRYVRDNLLHFWDDGLSLHTVILHLRFKIKPGEIELWQSHEDRSTDTAKIPYLVHSCFIYLFIFCLRNDSVSSSDCTGRI
jgi:hypothetical protein